MLLKVIFITSLILANIEKSQQKTLNDDEKLLMFGLETDDNVVKERMEKSLLNTFPFIDNRNGAHSHDHYDHHDHHESHHGVHGNLPQDSSRIQGSSSNRRHSLFPFKSDPRQAVSEEAEEASGDEETDVSDEINLIDFNALGEAASEDEDIASGRKCIDKVIMTEETVYEEVITCDHSYDKRCHTSYVTSFVSQQEEECEEHFKKSCYIDYEPLAYNETVEVCRTPVVKDCKTEGPAICKTVYESECWTKQKVHEVEDDVTSCQTVHEQKCKEVTVGYTTKDECDEWPVERCTVEKKLVKKVTPETGCHKEPVELCAPKGCGFTNGPVACHERVKTIVVDKPMEECNIEPIKTCKHVTKLVPKLSPVQECVDVPKEICARSKTNPRKVKKPVVKKWCYIPSKESGLE